MRARHRLMPRWTYDPASSADTNELVTGEEQERARRGDGVTRGSRAEKDKRGALQKDLKRQHPGTVPQPGHAPQAPTRCVEAMEALALRRPSCPSRFGTARAPRSQRRLAAQLGPARRVADARVEGKPDGSSRTRVPGTRRRRWRPRTPAAPSSSARRVTHSGARYRASPSRGVAHGFKTLHA